MEAYSEPNARRDHTPSLRPPRQVTYRKIDCAHCGKSAVLVVSPAGELLGVV